MNIEKLRNYIANNSNKKGCIYIQSEIYNDCNNVDVLLVLCALTSNYKSCIANNVKARINLKDLERYYINDVRINNNTIIEFLKDMIFRGYLKIYYGNSVIIRGVGRYLDWKIPFYIIDTNSVYYYLDYYFDTLTKDDIKSICYFITHENYSFIDYFNEDDYNSFYINIRLGKLDKYEHRIYDSINNKRIVIDIWNNEVDIYNKKRKRYNRIKYKKKTNKKIEQASNIIEIK